MQSLVCVYTCVDESQVSGQKEDNSNSCHQEAADSEKTDQSVSLSKLSLILFDEVN